MSRCTVRGLRSPDSSPPGRTRKLSRSSDTALVLSGQRGAGPVIAARWVSKSNRGTVSSGCGCRKAVRIRPSAAGRNRGIRPRSIRLATSEVMNTVLPAR